MMGNAHRKGWSGEIPLHKNGKNNLPWLLKVPTSLNQNFVSFWVRVIREDIPNMAIPRHPQRILVIIWPLFMVKSLLASDTTVHKTNEPLQFLVKGQGEKTELVLPGTCEDDHELVFNTK